MPAKEENDASAAPSANNKNKNKNNADDDATASSSKATAATAAAAATTTIMQQPLRTFFITTNKSIKSPLFRKLDYDLRIKRKALLVERGWEMTDAEHQAYDG